MELVGRDGVRSTLYEHRLRSIEDLIKQGEESGEARLFSVAANLCARYFGERDPHRCRSETGRLQAYWANALRHLGILTSDVETLKQATRHFEVAIEALEPLGFHDQVAECRAWRASAIGTTGSIERDQSKLTYAINVLSELLGSANFEPNTVKWARCNINLGNAVTTLGVIDGDPNLIRRGIVFLHAALPTFSQSRGTDWSIVNGNLGNSLLSLALMEGDIRLFRRSIKHHVIALRQKNLLIDARSHWATLQYNLGNAILQLGQFSRNAKCVEESTKFFRRCIQIRTKQAMHQQWMLTLMSLSGALAALHQLTGARHVSEEAITLLNTVISECESSGNKILAAEGRRNRALVVRRDQSLFDQATRTRTHYFRPFGRSENI